MRNIKIHEKTPKFCAILVKPGLFWCEQVCVPVHRWRLGMISNRTSFAAHSCVRLNQFYRILIFRMNYYYYFVQVLQQLQEKCLFYPVVITL